MVLLTKREEQKILLHGVTSIGFFLKNYKKIIIFFHLTLCHINNIQYTIDYVAHYMKIAFIHV